MVLWMEESLHHSIYPILQDLQRLGDPRGFKISSIHRRGPKRMPGAVGVLLGLCWGYTGIMEKKMETTI